MAGTQHRPAGSRLRVVAIAAVADNGVIGSGAGMLWHLPEDFRRFRAETTGNTLIIGRRTHESIGRPLPGRRTIVITRQTGWTADGVETAHSVEEAFDLAAQTPDKVCFIAGGGEIYAAAWPHLDELDITHVHQTPTGATVFPLIDADVWQETSRDRRDGFDFTQYRRKDTP